MWYSHLTELEEEQLGCSAGFEAYVEGEEVEYVEQRFEAYSCRALQHGFEAHGGGVQKEQRQWEGGEAGIEVELRAAGNEEKQVSVGNTDSTGWSDELVEYVNTSSVDFNRFSACGQLIMEYVIPALCLVQSITANKAMCWQLMMVAMAEGEQQVLQSAVQAMAKHGTLFGMGACNIVQQVVQHIGLNECWLGWWLAVTAVVIRLSHLGRYRENTATRMEGRQAARIRKRGLQQMKALVVLSLLQEGHAMQGDPAVTQQLMEQVTNLAMAATRAATAAESALQATAGGASSSASSGLQATSCVLKNPDTFDGSNPHDLMSWSSRVNEMTAQDLQERMTSLNIPCSIPPFAMELADTHNCSDFTQLVVLNLALNAKHRSFYCQRIPLEEDRDLGIT